MAEIRPIARSVRGAGYLLGRKLDSIPFGGYHILIIAVLALVGFIEGYDLVITGSLLVLAKAPLQLTGSDIRWLAVGPTFMLCIGGFASSAISDHFSRKTVMLIGVIATTFFTLLIPLVQNAEQLIILRLLTGIGAGGAVSAAFPIAAELMPAQHRRTYGACYEMALAISFTVVPFLAFLLAGNPHAFRFLALPGGLAITVVPVLVYFVIPESPRWHLRRGHPQAAADIVNRIISRSGDRVPPLTVENDRLCARRIAARHIPDADGASGGAVCDVGDDRGRADHRFHRAVGLHRHPRLPVRAVPDGAARGAGTFSANRSVGSSPASWRRF